MHESPNPSPSVAIITHPISGYFDRDIWSLLCVNNLRTFISDRGKLQTIVSGSVCLIREGLSRTITSNEFLSMTVGKPRRRVYLWLTPPFPLRPCVQEASSQHALVDTPLNDTGLCVTVALSETYTHAKEDSTQVWVNQRPHVRTPTQGLWGSESGGTASRTPKNRPQHCINI